MRMKKFMKSQMKKACVANTNPVITKFYRFLNILE